MDSFIIKAIGDEWRKMLSGARIQRIAEIRKHEFFFGLRTPGENKKVLISCNPSHPSIHLTEGACRATSPSPFCMILRKHLIGGTLQAISLPSLERTLTLTVHRRKESGVLIRIQLIIEIMGRWSNLILIDPDSGKIIDCARHIPGTRNRFRELLPGHPYIAPPPPDKVDTLHLTPADIPADLQDRADASRWLVENLKGLSPLLAKEILYRSRGHEVFPIIQTFMENYRTGHFDSSIYRSSDQGRLILSACRLAHLTDFTRLSFSTMNAAAERYRKMSQEDREIEPIRSALLVPLEKVIAKQERILEQIEKDRTACKELDRLRQSGEWIQANLYHLKKGMTEAELTDPMGESSRTLRVALDPRLAPYENAQRYFRRYRKLQRMEAATESRFRKIAGEQAYLVQVRETIRQAETAVDLEEIREELAAGKYLAPLREMKKQKSPEPRPPRCYLSSEGHTLLVGRNNHGNDRLITRIAQREDLWFHARGLPGAHVILRNPQREEISPKVLHEAAHLAAYYSRGKEHTKVPVVYTLRKHVKKPPGAKPGMVLIHHEKTLLVAPRKEGLPVRCPGEDEPEA